MLLFSTGDTGFFGLLLVPAIAIRNFRTAEVLSGSALRCLAKATQRVEVAQALDNIFGFYG